MKIIVVGAGIGGLRFAANAAAAGHDVSVFERAATIQAMRYPWHDDVSRTAFSRAGLDVPEGCFPKKNWSFVSPSGDIRRMYESLEESDISVPRPALNAMLAAACERAGAKLCFGINVEGAIVENGAVKGVSASGERYAADLVVDSTGVGSPLKTGLDIDIADKSEIFYAYRGFHEKNPAPEPEHTNKVYLKHLGENGISWAIQDGDVVDVLIGRLGGLDITTKERALAALKADNPVIGERIVMGGGIYKIPVRYPAARMTASGYAAIGDAAYMTIPMLGSGIASSLAAADMLFAIVNGKECARNGFQRESLALRSRIFHPHRGRTRRSRSDEAIGFENARRGVVVVVEFESADKRRYMSPRQRETHFHYTRFRASKGCVRNETTAAFNESQRDVDEKPPRDKGGALHSEGVRRREDKCLGREAESCRYRGPSVSGRPRRRLKTD